MTAPAPVLHATLVALRFAEGWRGALLRGPSGAGKSDLALRALDQGFRLVADDRVLVWMSGARLWGRAPPPLQGLVEARHLGILRRGPLPLAPVSLAVDLRDSAPDRMPPDDREPILGVRTPRVALRPFEACTPARIAAALRTLPPSA